MVKVIRYDQSNQNIEALKGRYGNSGESWGSVSVIRNVLFVIAYQGAVVTDYQLPACYDGFLTCSDGSIVQVTDSKLTLNLAPSVSAQGILKLTTDN